MSVEIERIATSEFAPRQVRYLDVNKLHELFNGLYGAEVPKSLVLVGPKGIGKSLSVASFAAKQNVSVVTFDCSEDVRRSHLLGMFVLRGDQTPFVLGPLTTAFEVANETGACILLLEEINALTPQMQKILNSTTDFRRRVEVPECQKVFQLQPGKKLWVVGTMNTAVYGGVYAMNEDLKSRLRLLVVDYPAPAEEKSIVQEALNGGSKKVDQKMMDQVILLAHETRQKALDYALSTRDVVQMVEDIGLVGLESAMRLVLGKFEGDDRTTVKERITSIFGVEVG
jgi:nitric oxide reductase NorQ protein